MPPASVTARAARCTSPISAEGILGANGIVGGGVGLAVGAALAAQLDGKGRVSVVFFGDGGANQGVVMEAINLAALWKLPLLLVCENNGFSEFSSHATASPPAKSLHAPIPIGAHSAVVDGNDVQAVHAAAQDALERARVGTGPTLIEARTYRWRGHVETEKSFLSVGISHRRGDRELGRARSDRTCTCAAARTRRVERARGIAYKREIEEHRSSERMRRRWPIRCRRSRRL